MLTSYANSYRGSDSSHWLFANIKDEPLNGLAMQIDFMFSRDGGGFSHNLRTVVLDTRGRIQHIFNGNKWSAESLADEMKSAMKSKP